MRYSIVFPVIAAAAYAQTPSAVLTVAESALVSQAGGLSSALPLPVSLELRIIRSHHGNKPIVVAMMCISSCC